jgi:hypothetical protein
VLTYTAAYTNSVPDATATTLYSVTTTTRPWLVTIGGPNGVPSPDNGEVHSIAPTQSLETLAIHGQDNAAFGTIGKKVYSLDLGTGVTTALGDLPDAQLPPNVSVLSLAAVTGLGNPSPQLTIHDAAATQRGPLPPEAVFDVTLSAPSTQQVTVRYDSADDTAQAGRDYTATSGTLAFAPGQISRTIIVPVITNGPAMPETFFVRLSNASAADLGRGLGVGTIRAAGQQLFPSGTYTEDFSDAPGSQQPAFDGTGMFQHLFLNGAQQHAINAPSDVSEPGLGFKVDTSASPTNPALVLSGGMDRVTFPDLVPGTHVGFAKVDLPNAWPATVRFVGLNGTFEVQQTDLLHPLGSASVGEEHVLPSGLELGPISEVDLVFTGSPAAVFDNVKVLVVPDRPPNANDDYVDTPPDTQVSIAPLTNDMAQDGGPLHIVTYTDPAHGRLSYDETSMTFIYFPDPGYESPDAASADTFTYTVADILGQQATGTVHVFVHAPPEVSDSTFTFATSLTTVNGETDTGVVTPNPFGGPDKTTYQLALHSLRNDQRLADGDAFEGAVVNAHGHVIGTFALQSPIGPDTVTFPITASADPGDPGAPLPASGELDLKTGKLAITWNVPTLPQSFASSLRASYVADTPLVVSDPDQGLLARNRLDPRHDKAILVSGPAHGQLVFHDDGTFVYTPTQHDQLDVPMAVFGSDSFTWVANDGLDSLPATVTLNQDIAVATHTHDYRVSAQDSFSHTDFVTHGADNIDVGNLHVPLGVTIHTHPSTHSPDTFQANTGTLTHVGALGLSFADLADLVARPDPRDPNHRASLVFTIKSPPGDGWSPHHGSLWTDIGYLDGPIATGPHDTIYTDPDNTGDLNPDGSFWYVPADGFTGLDKFTFRVVLKLPLNGKVYEYDSAPTTLYISVPPDNTTGADGVLSWVEDAGPNHGDGNHDGVPDRAQESVASLPAALFGLRPPRPSWPPRPS